MFITINILFYFKYLYRISFAAGIISVVCYLLFSYYLFIGYKKPFLSKKALFAIISAFVIGCVVVLFMIPKESLHVDRWEMIDVFWNAASEGLYPYTAHSDSGNYPGPMPFYFILSYPFYLLDEIGYMSILSVVLLLVYFYKRVSYKQFFLMTLLLLSSLAIYWEIFARSTIFFNSCLFAVYLFYLKGFKDFSNKQFYLTAVAGGLLFSIRNIFVLALIVWGIYMLFQEKIKIGRLLKWGSVFILSFGLTFVPFILMNPAEFFVMNPFVIQSSFLIPFGFILVFICCSVAGAFFCKKYPDIIFLSAALLFCMITAHVAYTVSINGINSYLVSGTDISYYIFCFPFLLDIIVSKCND